MIWEVWQYLTTPVSPLAKKLGYLYESIALSARSERCRYVWASHFEFCRQSIEQSIQACQKKRIALIFGAGSLQDIPLAKLSREFEKVILVDMLFLKSARKMAQNFSNVELVEFDITESLEALSAGILKINTPTAWLDNPVDLVVSLNVITQLPLLPVRWMTRHFSLSDAQADELGRTLIEQHLAYLQKFGSNACLIADREAFEYSIGGDLIDQFDPWWDVKPPKEQESWLWEVVPLEESRGKKLRQVNRVAVSRLDANHQAW
jgi:hypothetical protein